MGVFTPGHLIKGEIYVRKNIENGPKRKIISEECLAKLSKGDVSLDIQSKPVASKANDYYVIIEDVMSESSPSTVNV